MTLFDALYPLLVIAACALVVWWLRRLEMRYNFPPQEDEDARRQARD